MKSSPVSIVITAVISALALGAGLIIGYLLRSPPIVNDPRVLDNALALQSLRMADNDTVDNILKRCEGVNRHDEYINKFLLSSHLQACRAAACTVELPRTYVVYKLSNGDIDIDGKMEEQAWQDVAWTEAFVDINGELVSPRFETKVKLRWNDTHLYVGAYVEEYAVWANKTLHDTTIYQDNSFQILLDTDQSNHNYKEISINAFGTISDMMLTRPYLDDGEPLLFWESEVVRAVHIDGPINDPTRRNKHWTVEMAIPFKQLFGGVGREHDIPQDGEVWRANFVRSEWQTEIANGKYLKRLDLDADWWVWTSPGVPNIHLPDRWGLLQFRDAPVNSTLFKADERWTTINALLEIYRAQKAYKAITGHYTENKELLHLPPYVLSSRCLRDLHIKLDWAGFRVTARPIEEHLEDGHTRTDRFIWFGKERQHLFH